MIMHGGDNGEMHEYGVEGGYIFEWTCEELKNRLDIGEGEKMPTLEELLIAVESCPDMLLNIELKAPYDAAIAQRYDHFLAA